MKVVIICAVVGNLPVVQECLNSWLPLPESWELYIYKSKFTTIDGTAEFLESKKTEKGITIIEDGEHRSHVWALTVLFDEIKKKNFDWIIHLDSDAKLLNREFYSWANAVFSDGKYKVWGKNHVRGSSKIDPRKILYLGRAHSWILMAEMNFLIKNDICFDDLRIDGVVSVKSNPPKIINSKEVLNVGEKVLVFGDTGWQLYTEASRFGLYQNMPDEIYKMWHHKNNQSESWKLKNRELLKKTFGTKKMITIATVLKCGGDYTSYHVEVLKRSIEKNISSDYRFVCLTDSYSNDFPTIKLEHGWRGWWSKMELFKLNGPVLYFDLDTIIVGNLEPLIDIAKNNTFSILRDVFQGEKNPNAMQSSVMAWNGDMRYLYEKFKKEDANIIKKMHGDQTFITRNVNSKNVKFFQDIIPENLLSFKAHVKQSGLTEKTSVVFFHGYPRPWQQNIIPYDNIQK